ncbi:MAG TPA: amidohydrolase/deacetylase family metallohydrolase [Chloroflexota bacterium]|jgi:dihydroorotase
MAEGALLLRGGHVIDPAQDFDRPADVRVRDGRIEAVGPSLAADGATVLDVGGCLVLPGLIDGHVHCFRGMNHSLGPDVMGVSRGVTTVVDAGSASHSSFPVFKEHVIAQATTRVLAYVHLSSLGAVVGPDYAKLADPRLIDPEGIAEVASKYAADVVGIKIHATSSCMGPLGVEPLRRGRVLADELGLRTMVHIGESWGDLPEHPADEVVEFLRPGDVLTHAYTAQRGNLLDANGRLYPAVRAARERGVRFDIGHGSSNLNFDVARRLLDMDFAPDTVSTDGSHRNLYRLVHDLPTVMSKLLMLGLPLRDLVAMATSEAAAVIGRSDELGSLAPGHVADVSVLRLEEHEWTALDSQGQRCPASQRLVPVLTVRAGEVIPPRPDDPELPGAGA